MTVKLAVPKGTVDLASKEGSLYKRAILCREGIWEGAYGTCHVTAQLLEMLADRYNRQRAKPINENDYAPILKNHNRDIDGVIGRLIPPLTVEDMPDPETGVVGKALMGSIRIDDTEAQKAVDEGKYAQGSLNFDEQGQTEIFEWSFVAVEAARRSQVLEQGENKMSVELQKQLEAANAKHQALSHKLAAQRGARKETLLAMATTLSASNTALASFDSMVKEVQLQVRQVALTSQLRGYIREGKLSKAEFDKLDVKKLSALDPEAAKIVLQSYEDRKPSADIIQHGQAGAKPVELGSIPAAEYRRMMEAQLSGKPYQPGASGQGVALAEGDAGGAADDKDGKKKPAEGQGDSEMKFSDVEDTLKKLGECMPAVAKLREHMKAMDEAISKMRGTDEEDAA
jgi:hypothetical protein